MIQIGHGSGYSKFVGNGRETEFFFYKGSVANFHGSLFVRRIIFGRRIMEYANDWYNDHKLGVWFWTTFSTWVVLFLMIGLMMHALMSS